MLRRLSNVWELGVKELFSLAYDPVLALLILYAFSYAVYAAATGEGPSFQNASIAIVDEDHSALSRRIAQAFLPPYFHPPKTIATAQIDPGMEAGLYTFVVDIPPGFGADVLAGRQPTLQLLVDATAMSQAGRGALYVQEIVAQETARWLSPDGAAPPEPASLAIRTKFNPNLVSEWFSGAMEVVNNITLLTIILTGAAVIREREHGTLEHLLVMPLRPVEIMLSKIWANGLVIVVAAVISLLVVVRGVLGVPIRGSLVLFAAGASIYVFSVSALGILLATIARSMPQFGLLAIPVFMILNLLSGTYTPMESIPPLLAHIMVLAPTVHFASFSKAVLFRGADLLLVAPQLGAVAATGAAFFAAGLARFRGSVAAAR